MPVSAITGVGKYSGAAIPRKICKLLNIDENNVRWVFKDSKVIIKKMEEIVDKSNVILTTDIYDLSWYTLYLMEVYGKPSATDDINNICSILKTIIEENKEFLQMILYDKELIIGILLSYYIALKSKFYSNYSVKPGLSKVLEAVKNYIDEYNTYGEVLYALKKLDTVTDIVREFIDIDGKIRILFNNSEDALLKGDLHIDYAEDLSYIIWLICENNAYDIVEKGNLMRVILDDRLYNLVLMDYKSIAVYANALANFILKCKLKYGEEISSTLRERSEEIYKTLEFYIKTLSQLDEGVSKALIGKMGLGFYSLSKALQKLRDLSEAQRVRRKYGIALAVLTLLVIAFITFPTVAYTLQSATAYGVPVRLPVVTTLISLLLYIIDNLLENRASRWFIEVLKSILRAFTSHS